MKVIHCPRCQVGYVRLSSPGDVTWGCTCGAVWDIKLFPDGDVTVVPA